MSLQVYLIDEPDEPTDVIRDVEAAFINWRNTGTEYSKRIVRAIDNGKLGSDPFGYTDRFGKFRSIEDLSTGTKGALLVEIAEKPVALIERGFNAIQEILRNATSGKVLMEYTSKQFTGGCDLTIEGRHFSRLEDFTEFLEEEIY